MDLNFLTLRQNIALKQDYLKEPYLAVWLTHTPQAQGNRHRGAHLVTLPLVHALGRGGGGRIPPQLQVHLGEFTAPSF